MAGQKRKLDEWDVSEIESTGAAVHGVVTKLSPVKHSKRNSMVCYFDGELSDGHKRVRVISFDPSLRSVLESTRARGAACLL